MTDKLNPEQRRRVAEQVLPGGWQLLTMTSGTQIIYSPRYGFWRAELELEQKWALVRWLASKLEYEHDLETEEFLVCMSTDNTEALERMVHEVLEAQDG